jgi:hypothetical protein
MGALAAWAGVMTAGIGIGFADDQAKLEKERVELSYRDNLEKIRRRKFDIEQIKGAGKALSETAGVRHTSGSTPQGYVQTMASEFHKELTWMRKYAERARKLGIESANVNRKIGTFNAIKSGISLGGSIYGMS